MTSDSSWKTAVSFSDRLAAIVSMSTAYQRSSQADDYSEAQREAKSLEEHAFNSAKSKEEYEQLCQESIDNLESQIIKDSSITRTVEEPPSSDEGSDTNVDIGRFKNALYHKNGISSTVYKSKADDGNLVALKVTTPHMMTAPHDPKREAAILSKAEHAHVIPLVETFNEGGSRFVLVFPFIQYNLDDLLHRDALTNMEVRSHLRDLFAALAHLHSLNIIHRDVKPSNILLASPSGPAYLADFGIAWSSSDEASEPDSQKITDVGTTCYRAPEILFGDTSYGVTLDLWAAGCVVAEAVDVKHRQLFDSGELGSELALIQSIFSTLGTPDEKTWPESKNLPDWGKMQFYDYPPKPWREVLQGAPSQGRDLVGRLVRYESQERISAAEALDHPYLSV